VQNLIDLANKVLIARESQGVTQTDLAKRSGVNRSWLVQFEAGYGNPTFKSIVAVLSALGLELDVIPAPVVDAPSGPVDLQQIVRGLTKGAGDGDR